MKDALKANYWLKFAQDVALNCVIEKVKPRYKVLYKVLKEEDEYYTLLEIYPYLTLIQFK